MTLRAQLLFALGMLAALPVAIFGFAQARAAADAAGALADRETLLASTSLARELGRLLEDHATLLRALATEVGAMGKLDLAIIDRRTRQYVSVFPGLYTMLITDPGGRTVAGAVLEGTTFRSAAGTMYVDRAWFHELQRGAPFVATVLKSRLTGRPALILSAPVFDDDGERLGFSVMGIDLESVQRALERVTEAAPGLSTVVHDGLGRLVASSGGPSLGVVEQVGAIPLYRMIAGDDPERLSEFDERGEMRRGTVAPLKASGIQWWVTTTWPQAAVRHRAATALLTTVEFGVFTLALGIGAAVLLAKLMTGPVNNLSRLVEAMSHGDLRVRPERAKDWYPKELEALLAVIDRMLMRLQEIIGQLGGTVDAVSAMTVRLHDASSEMLGDSNKQHQAVQRSSGAIVQMSDSLGSIGVGVREVAEAVSSTTGTIVSLDQQIDHIGHGLHTLADTIDGAMIEVDRMQQQVRAMAMSATALGQNVEKTSDSLQVLTESIQKVTSSAERGQSLSREALAAAEAGRDAVEETIAATREIQHRFDAVGAAVHSLAGRSEAIGQVVSVIDEVTRATQLVAINASILAAEAGEHGKGFSIVAGRVRAMAEETALSTDQISRLIAAVQADIQSAVAAVQSGQETVRAGERRSEEAGVRLRAIIDSSGQAERTVQQIADAMREQAARVRLVRAALGEVHQATARIERAVDAEREAQAKMGVAIAAVRSFGDDVRQSTEAQQKVSRSMTAAVRATTSRFQAIAQAMDAQSQERHRIEEALGVFDGAAQGSVERAAQIGEVVRALHDKLEQLERQLGAFRVD
jgi:methyl-accepting chemotaxis protein